MTTVSSIEWTTMTWNPTTGCTKISPGCKHCYAETMSRRLKAMGMRGYERGFEIATHPERLGDPRRQKRPQRFFVDSMSDLFHAEIPFAYVDQVFAEIGATPEHTYMILTKRADRLAEYFQSRPAPAQAWPNVWLGVSVEDRTYGLTRLDYLRRVDCRVRFLSVEPLLEDLGVMDLRGIHWVIVGGESGPQARPMQPAWAEGVLRQCQAADLPFFFKQWGTWGPDGVKRSKKRNGRLLLGRLWEDRPT
jgi:protein gp37